jgi:branched-subunit amino acid permease
MTDGSMVWLPSPEPLTTFLAITGKERDAIELHNQSLRLNATIMPVVALIEIGPSNAIGVTHRLAARI